MLHTLADTNGWSHAVLTALVLTAVAVPVGAILWSRRRFVRQMQNVVLQLAKGRTDVRADPIARGALGDLARAVNTLASQWQSVRDTADQDRQHLSALLEETEELVIATDEADRVTLLNLAASRVLDKKPDAVLGKRFYDLFTQHEVLELYREAYSATGPVTRELRLAAPERMVLCRATAVTIYNGPQYRGTMLLMRDLTDIAQAVQMKTDFVANASHELRTPLASIRAAVETIKESGIEDTETTKRCIDIIGSHVLRLQMMVQDLLDLSRTEDPRAVVRSDRVDLQQVCELVIGMYNATAAEKKITLTAELQPDAQFLRGDERLLLLTIKNLVDNAMKFTTQGGIVIRAYLTNNNQPRQPDQPASALVVEVADTGCGIPKEDQQRVFERFYTVNRSRGGADRGTGLGLAIVKHAVAAMDGLVTLESEVNKGTTIRCAFNLRR